MQKIAAVIDLEKKKSFHEGYQIAKELYFTQSHDIAILTLHEDFGFGPNRIAKYHDAYEAKWNEFEEIAKNDTPDKEYTKDVLDRRIKAAVPEDRYCPYKERYMYDFDFRYDYDKGLWIKNKGVKNF